MLFSSFEFIFFFLPVALIGYYLTGRLNAPHYGKLWLLLCSLAFYGWWNPVYLPLLAGSICTNYFISRRIAATSPHLNPVARSAVFVAGILFNIVLLGYFKYANFFVENANIIFGQHYFLEKIVLPLGISFFTIQQIAFLMDTYEDIAQEKNFIDYGLFVTFFPHLLAGPILHHKQMMPQFAETKKRHFDAKNFSIGLFLFSLGLFKKVVVADPLSAWVSAGYSLQEQMAFIDAWVTSLSYTFQLYFDFSGYVDMAIGISLMFNITLPKNFDSPYKATSVINFWDRWHITLSKFITTYIYTPLVRNFPGRVTFHKSMLAILLAMFVAGWWHGAAWPYVIYGSFHGVGLVVNHVWRRTKIKMPLLLAWLSTFVFVNVSFVIFRAESIGQAWTVVKALFGFSPSRTLWSEFHVVKAETIQQVPWLTPLNHFLPPGVIAGSILLLLLGICLLCQNSGTLAERFKPNIWYALLQLILIVIPVFMMNGVVDFVYFQF